MNILDITKYNEIISEYSDSISDQPALFVSDYASYNEGHICGAWFDLDNFSDQEEFLEKVDEFFKKLDEVAPLDFNYPREEIMYQDYQGFPRSLYCESEASPKIWEYIDAINEDENFAEVIDAYEACIGGDYEIENVKESFFCNLNDYEPQWNPSIEEKFGYYLKDNGMMGFEIPDAIESYFDFEQYGKESLWDYSEHDGFVFTNH